MAWAEAALRPLSILRTELVESGIKLQDAVELGAARDHVVAVAPVAEEHGRRRAGQDCGSQP